MAPAPARIAFVIGGLDFGGAEKHLSMILPALPKDEFSAELHVLVRKGALAPTVEGAGVPVFAPPLTRKPAGDRALFKIVQIVVSACALAARFVARRPTIVHFFLPESYLVGAPLAVLTGRPLRVMSRRSLNDYQNKYPIFAWIERRLHRLMTRVLGNSRSVVEQLVREEGVARERCALIYNGCDVHAWPADSAVLMEERQAARQKFGLGPDELAFVIVANLIPYKGHLDLVRALALFADGAPRPWRLLVVGRDDGAGDAVRQEATRLHVGDRLQFLGETADVRPVLAAGDVGLLVSHQEGFSNALLEYMAARLPVVATDVGGNAEAVMHNETGFIVPPRAPEALAGALRRLADDGELRRVFGEAGRKRVEERFSNERCVAEYVSLYRTLLRASANGAA